MRLRRMFTILDSRLRGNDVNFEVFGLTIMMRRLGGFETRSYEKRFFTLTFMAEPPWRMKNPQAS